MNLTVGSYLELYTTMYGWLVYNLIWDLLVMTMIAFLPFGWIIAKNWRDAVASSDERPPATVAVKRVTIELSIAFIVLFLAGIPMYQLRPQLIEYHPTPTFENLNPAPVTQATDPTTYKTTLGAHTVEGGIVEIPAWWWVTSAISTGMAHAIAQALPREGDIRAAQQQIGQVNINDPQTVAEYGQFVSDCFAPARAKLQQLISMKGTAGLPAGIASAIATYGNVDVEWAGSHGFLDSEGFYKPSSNSFDTGAGLRARSPVEGWPGDTQQERDLGLAGKPWCDDWWLGTGGLGLKEKLLLETQANDGLWTRMKTAVSQLAGVDAITLEDTRIKNLLSQTAAHHIAPDYSYVYQTSSANPTEWVLDKSAGILQRVFNTMGIGTATLGFNTALDAIKMFLPMMQAVLLMGIFVLLPFAIVIMAYRWEYLFALTLVVFSFHFFTALWALANFFDQYLARALFPTTGSFLTLLINDASGSLNKRMLLDILTGGLFLGLPFVWFFLMGVAGVGAVKGATYMTSQVGAKTQSAAESGGGKVEHTANNVTTLPNKGTGGTKRAA